MSKAGLKGIGMLVVPIMASIFSAKTSTGVLLPMLIMGDILGVIYYHRHAKLNQLLKLAPSTILGIVLGVYVGKYISAFHFNILLAIIVIASVFIMLWQNYYSKQSEIPKSKWFARLAGLIGGFTTMVGNAAGPVMTIYFLSMKLPKQQFIGTAAWFFLLVNVFKVPFHVLSWETIKLESFGLNLMMLPLILLGAFIGFKIVKLIPEKPYRIFILVSVGISALRLLF